jgi:hypothetical protein
MGRLLQYRRSDGSLVGVWEGPATYLEVQIVADDPTYGYLPLAEDHPESATLPSQLLDAWAVQEGLLVAKQALTLHAAPNPFVADGSAVCLVTVQPFAVCTLLVNGTPIELTLEDTTLELTSDVPTTFTIGLQPMATHWAAPLTVEAEAV